MHVTTAVFSIPLAVLAGAALAQSPAQLQQVHVSGNKADLLGIADSATEGSVSAQQLATRPLLRAAEVLETVPGMIVTQHSGDGKANQYFLRGFNLDHGTDFSTRVIGMPVNLPSHAHGQGYMDLNFLLPELISSVRYRKGVYAAEDGNFSNTGAARIDYVRTLAAPLLDLTLGKHGYRRALLAGSTSIAGRDLLAALEVASNNGPWDQPEQLRKLNGALRWSAGSVANGYAVSLLAYRSRWTATEHVPARAVDNGTPDSIGRFGALSPNDGGITHRYSLSAQWARQDRAGSAQASAYLVDYALQLYSAPSGFMSGALGDQHEQADRRRTLGAELRRSMDLGAHELMVGAQLRHDRVDDVGLFSTHDRVRTGTVRQDRVRESAIGLFGEWHAQWLPWLRSTLGLRQDLIDARVTPLGGRFNSSNGGPVRASQTSPKLSVVLAPRDAPGRSEVYANWGYGFHSNDVRGATSDFSPVDGSALNRLDVFSRAVGAELGMRSQLLPGWTSTLSLWRMALASELVFIGDAGVTEAKGASRRHGLEWSNFFTPVPGVIVDADLAYARARFRAPVDGGGTHVPNAVPLTAALGVSVDRGGAWFGGLHGRYVGAYALEESAQQRSNALVNTNLKLGYRIAPRLQVVVEVLNLLNRRGNDIEYWGGSCTRGEQREGACGNGAGEGIDGRLVHPIEPRSARVNLRATF